MKVKLAEIFKECLEHNTNGVARCKNCPCNEFDNVCMAFEADINKETVACCKKYFVTTYFYYALKEYKER